MVYKHTKYIKFSDRSTDKFKIEKHNEEILIPQPDHTASEPLDWFLEVEYQEPWIGRICYNLMEVLYYLDAETKRSATTAFGITNLSKKHFGEYSGPTEQLWPSPPADKKKTFDATDKDVTIKPMLQTKSILAELAKLAAPIELWDGNLEDVNNIVVSLAKNPVQDYTELIKNISSKDLETYAKQGLSLWCKNTASHYDEKTGSIKDAETWNANFGLLVKARWAVWLLLIKEKKVDTENLQSSVELRRFGKRASTGVDGKLAWQEYSANGVKLKMLTDPKEQCIVLRPYIDNKVGNVCFAIWSLIEDLTDESPTSRYTELRTAMEKIATDTLQNCMTDIPLQEDMDKQKVTAGEIPQVSATPDPFDIDLDDLF